MLAVYSTIKNLGSVNGGSSDARTSDTGCLELGCGYSTIANVSGFDCHFVPSLNTL